MRWDILIILGVLIKLGVEPADGDCDRGEEERDGGGEGGEPGLRQFFLQIYLFVRTIITIVVVIIIITITILVIINITVLVIFSFHMVIIIT